MRRACVAVALCLGCTPSATTRAPDPVPDSGPRPAVDEASAQASAAPQQGAAIELDIPLVSGDSEPLSNLRGKVVVLLISSSDRSGWGAFRTHYEQRLQALGRDRLVVVAVANDADPKPLLAEWDRDPPPFLLGWDPAGALALRLGVAGLPAVFVLDPRGRAQGSVASLDPQGLLQIDAWIDAVLPPAPLAEPAP